MVLLFSTISNNYSSFLCKHYLKIKSGGHWEKTFTGDALQNPKPSVFSIKLSVFTISLLKDSGYFEDVNENLSFSITWGKSKGCAFIMNTT